MGFIDKLKSFLTKPTKAFKAEIKKPAGNAFKYGFIGLAVLGILSTVITFLFGSILPLGGAITGAAAITSFFAILVAGFIALIISSAWLHLWVYIFGGRKGIGNTAKTVFYAYSPVYVLGWIPFVNFFANIWYLVLSVIGLTQLQKLSTGRAVGAVIVAIIIPLIIIAMMLFWAVSLFGSGLLAAMTQLGSIG